MKNYLFFTLLLLLAFSCQKENALEYEDSVIETRASNKVTLCHITGNGSFHAIEVNENAVDAHINHGDGYPDGCYSDGMFMSAECELIDISDVPEDCSNGVDDNCDGLTDDEDEDACGTCDICPAYTLEGALAADNFRYYNYKEVSCGGPFVGIEKQSSGVYGVNDILMLALSIEGVPFRDLSLEEVQCCEEIIIAAQEILNLPPFCGDQEGLQQRVFYDTNKLNK